MAEINEELTRKVAHLARLELTDEEVRTFTPQLREILKYVEQLGEVNLKASDGKEVEPLSHPLGLTPPLREDRVRVFEPDQNGKPKVLTHAPEVLSDGFKVPPIM